MRGGFFTKLDTLAHGGAGAMGMIPPGFDRSGNLMTTRGDAHHITTCPPPPLPGFQTFLRPCMSFSCDSQYVTIWASPSTMELEFKSLLFNV